MWTPINSELPEEDKTVIFRTKEGEEFKGYVQVDIELLYGNSREQPRSEETVLFFDEQGVEVSDVEYWREI